MHLLHRSCMQILLYFNLAYRRSVSESQHVEQKKLHEPKSSETLCFLLWLSERNQWTSRLNTRVDGALEIGFKMAKDGMKAPLPVHDTQLWLRYYIQEIIMCSLFKKKIMFFQVKNVKFLKSTVQP